MPTFNPETVVGWLGWVRDGAAVVVGHKMALGSQIAMLDGAQPMELDVCAGSSYT